MWKCVKNKTVSEGKNRKGTSDVHLICILDQFIYFPMAKNKLKGHFDKQAKVKDGHKQ